MYDFQNNQTDIVCVVCKWSKTTSYIYISYMINVTWNPLNYINKTNMEQHMHDAWYCH